MSYTYLLESGEVSSAECFSGIPAFVLSKSSLSAEKSSCNGNATESCPASQFGTMCEPLTASRGAEKSTASAEVSRVKTSQRQAKARASTEREADYGASSPVLLAKFDPNTRSWKTPQCSLLEDWGECLETFPKSGTMRDGLLWELTMWAHPTVASESGFWRIPTPLASDGSNRKVRYLRKAKFGARVRSVPYWILKNYNMRCTPTMSEWLMGYPISWTDSAPLAMDKFRLWRQQLLTF